MVGQGSAYGWVLDRWRLACRSLIVQHTAVACTPLVPVVPVPQLEVRLVETAREDDAFLRLPWRIYDGDPRWVPPLMSVQAELVGFRRHPFYDDARCQALLAQRGGDVVGRVAAIVNGTHQKLHDDGCGFFGFFECMDDGEAASALLAAAKDWLKGQGCRIARGPFSPSVNYESGLLVEGCNRPPAFLAAYNPPYYAGLIESEGFRKKWDLLGFEVERSMYAGRDPKLAFITDEALRRSGAKLRQFDRRRMARDIGLFFDLYNQTLDSIPFFTPMSPREIAAATSWLKMLTAPELTAIAEVEGRPVAVLYGLPDYNPIQRTLNGRMGTLGAIRWWWNRRRFSKVRFFSINVLPEFHAWGLGLALFRNVMQDGLALGLAAAELSWVLESSQLSRGSLERGGAVHTKTWRIYEAEL